MKCCNCLSRLDVSIVFKGYGVCRACGTEQAIKVIHSFLAIIGLIGVFTLFPFGILVKLLLSIFVGGVYLSFSKMEKVNKE